MSDLRGPAAMLADVREVEARGDAVDIHPFFGHRPPAQHVPGDWMLSQWAPLPFTVDGITYPHAEAWMMVGKAMLFGDADSALAILEESDPGACKRLGRAVRGFDAAAWDVHCYRIAARGNWHKFAQNTAACAYLLGTAPRVLVEASPYDRIWGVGIGVGDPRLTVPRAWPGRNLLGFALTEVRAAMLGVTP